MIIISAIDSIFVVAEVNSTIGGTAFASQDSDGCLQSDGGTQGSVRDGLDVGHVVGIDDGVVSGW